jgi:hypothetical protein
MSCNPNFLIWNLTDASVTNEDYVTEECINNTVKLGVFSTLVILWCFVTCFIVYLSVDEYCTSGRGQPHSPLRKRLHSLHIIASLGELISMVMILLGVTSEIRYIFYAIGPYFNCVCNTLCFHAWYKSLVVYSNDIDNRLTNVINRLIYSVNIYYFIVVMSLTIIGPCITYSNGDYNTLNWLFVIRTSLGSVVGIVQCLLIIIVGKKFICVCEEQGLANNTKYVLNKLAKVVDIISYIILPLQFILLFAPIWMIWNLHGVFWFRFIVYEFGMLFSIPFLSWLVKHNSKSSNLHTSFFSSSHSTDNKNESVLTTRTHIISDNSKSTIDVNIITH